VLPYSGELDYLVIGHVTRDQTADGWRTGGTAAYAARTAWAMGLRVGVLTSAADDVSKALAGIAVVCLPAAATTTFDNRYTDAGREQVVRALAAPLTAAAVPLPWRTARLVHLGPVANECDPALVDLFPGAFIGLTPQGWMRAWDEQGRVRRAPWEQAGRLLARADAVVLSEEDVAGDKALIARWAASTRVLAVTRAARGCSVYWQGTAQDVAAFAATEVDPTGAGDVFAAVFFARLAEGDEPPAAARLANCVAAVSVGRVGLAAAPTPAEVACCLDLCR